MKALTFLFLFTFSLGQLAAQEDYNTIYSIRVVSYSKLFDANQVVKKIGSLGVIRYENSEENTRIYLGNYLGKATVKRILRQVKKRGYKSAYIVEDSYDLSHSTGKYNTHTYQIGAFRKLNTTNLNYIPNDLQKEIYISYENRVYRISVGLFGPTMPGTEDYAKAIAKRIGPIAQQGYSRQFRKPLLAN